MINDESDKSDINEGLVRSLDDMCGTIEYSPPEVLMMMNQSSVTNARSGVGSVRTSASLDSLSSFDSSGAVDDPNGVHVYALDAWALGVVLYAMLFGTMPFNDAQRRMMAALGKHPPVVIPPRSLNDPNELSDAMDLLRRMLALTPNDRLSLDEISRHPWLAEEYSSRVQTARS
jgi:serine/threonine protein kinase